MALYKFDKSNELFQRATKVVPSGISGNKNPAFAVPGSFPYYAVRGEGCRYWDVDDNVYIDYLAGYGPIVLGYNDPVVDAAAEEQRKLGAAFNHPTPRAVELAEKLVGMIPLIDWCAFGKNGSDVTAYAVQTAREHTQRRKILKARGEYHGSQSWCRSGLGGLIESDFEHVLDFPWNDATAVEDLFKANDGDVIDTELWPLRVYWTPGHTEGGMCLHNAERRILFSGDTVFPDGYYGRYDGESGSLEAIQESLRRLNGLDVDALLPGHGEPVLSDGHRHIEMALRNATRWR